MRFLPAILASLVLISQAFASDPLRVRFSEDTLAALHSASDSIAVSLTERLPRTKHDKTGEITAPVILFLNEQIKNGTPLAEEDFESLKALLLNPANHDTGLFAVGDPPEIAIQFTAEGQTGYLILSSSGVSIYWKEKCQNALLNEKGTQALALWKKQKG